MNHFMSRTLILSSLAVLVVACGDKKAAENATEDSTTAAMTAVSTTPRVMAIEFGQAVDDSGRIMGGGVESFPSADTIYVVIRTQNATQGTPMTVKLEQGDKTIDSVEVAVGSSDGSGESRALATLPKAATVKAGKYKIEVLLDGASQGVREFSIGK